MTGPRRREAGDRLLVRWTLGGLGIIARAAGVLALTACSLAMAQGQVSSFSEVPEQGVTRKEIHDRFGQPSSSTICVDGRLIDVHAIKQRVPVPLDTVLAEIVTFGFIDLLLMPIVIADIEKTTVHFAFVYDASHVLVSRAAIPKNTEASATCATPGRGEGCSPICWRPWLSRAPRRSA